MHAINNFNELSFSFPEVHADAVCRMNFHRTLRIPDDGKTYPLPPSLGHFPMTATEAGKNLSPQIQERRGVMIPMYTSEALWISFRSNYHAPGRGTAYPFAVKIAAGKRSAVTANEWTEDLREKDYIVIPVQPWIDGFLVKDGVIKQFVTAIGGQGFTVEEQLTGKFEFGGIQIKVFPMKADEYERRFPYKPFDPRRNVIRSRSGGIKGMSVNSMGPTGPSGDLEFIGEASYSSTMDFMDSGTTKSLRSSGAGGQSVSSMGMAAGGSMKQEIHPDPYGIHVWDTRSHRCFVHLIDSMVWESVTGTKPPTVPPSAADYKKHNLPWFEYYSNAGALGGTENTDKVKSIEQLAGEKGYSPLPENQSVDVTSTVPLHATPIQGLVNDGKW